MRHYITVVVGAVVETAAAGQDLAEAAAAAEDLSKTMEQMRKKAKGEVGMRNRLL